MTDQIPSITRAVACLAGVALLDEIPPFNDRPHDTAIGVLRDEASRIAPTLREGLAAQLCTSKHYTLAGSILRTLSPPDETAALLCETTGKLVEAGAQPPPMHVGLEPYLADVLEEHPAARVRDLWLTWVRVGDALEELGAEATADAVCEYVIESTLAGFTADAQTFTAATLCALARLRP